MWEENLRPACRGFTADVNLLVCDSETSLEQREYAFINKPTEAAQAEAKRRRNVCEDDFTALDMVKALRSVYMRHSDYQAHSRPSR